MLNQTQLRGRAFRNTQSNASRALRGLWFSLSLIFTLSLIGPAVRVHAADDEDKDKDVEQASAQDSDSSSDEDSDEDSDEESSEETSQPQLMQAQPQSRGGSSSESDDGASVLVRIGGQAGEGVVQDQSLVPVELFPYILSDDQLFFSDLRFFSTVDLTLGGNAGLGYRRYSSGLNRIWGISGWYDGDATREDNYFQQFGVSVETYGEILDFRSNVYIPFGDTYQQSSLKHVNGSSQFVGANLQYDQIRSFYAAMKGFDLEAGIPLPGRVLEDRGVRLYGGMYHFVDDHDNNITGGTARLQANLFEGLDLGLQVTHDSYFDTRGFVNVAWTFGPLHRSNMSQRTVRGRLGEHVTRNYTVLAPEQHKLEENVVARDPSNGQAYTFAHVDSATSPGGNGDVNTPFQTIADAQAANRGVVYVHAGSTFSGADATIVMSAGERILGDGNGMEHFLNVPGLRSLLIPHGPTAGNAPVLNNSIGNAVTLASNSEFSGFTITNSAGHGVFGSGLQNVILRNLTVQNAGDDGMHFLNSSGQMTVANALINGATNEGLVIDGGSSTFRFAGTLSNNLGHDLVVQNTGGLVDLIGANFGGTGSQGILVNNVAGDVQFRDVSLDSTAGKGIEIVDLTGNVEFQGETLINDAGGNSVEVRNLGNNGTVTFGDVEIRNRRDRGFVIDNNDGVVSVEGSLEVGNQNGDTGSAIDIQNSSGNALLGPTVVTASTGDPGVNIVNNTGTTSISSLNLTGNNGTGLFANNGGTLRINPDGALPNGGEINVTNGTAVNIEDTAINIALRQVTSSNAAVGLRLVSTPGQFAVFGDGETATNTGGTISNATTGIFLQDVEAVALVSMTLESNGIGLQANDVDHLGVTNFRINDSTTNAFNLHNTRHAAISYTVIRNSGQEDIRATFSEVATNNYSFFHNSFESNNGDSIRIESQGGSAGAVMNLTVNTNEFTNAFAGGAALDLDWNGTLNTAMVSNGIIARGASSFGADIANAAANATTSLNFANNQFLGDATNTTVMNVATLGASQIAVSENLAQFQGTGGSGLKFSLGGSSAVNIVANQINDNTDGSTGVLFDSLTGPTTIGFSGNILTLGGAGGMTDRGVIFNSITNPVINGTTQYVILTSAANNLITGTDTLFSKPAGTTSGFLVINSGATPP